MRNEKIAKEGPDKKRLNLLVPQSTATRLKLLEEKTGAASHTEVIKSALLVYESLVEYLEQGYRFYVGRDDEDKVQPVRFQIDVQEISNKPADSRDRPVSLHRGQFGQAAG